MKHIGAGLIALGGVLFLVALALLPVDARGMALGLVFGVFAGIPTALLVLASDRRSNDTARDLENENRRLLLELERQRAGRISVINGEVMPQLPARREVRP